MGTWLLGNGELDCGVVTNSDGFSQLDGASGLFRGDAGHPRFITATAAAQRLTMEVMLVLRRLVEAAGKPRVGRWRCLSQWGFGASQ